MSAQELKLTADGPTEQRILDYLKKNASAVLIEKINAGKKTLAGAVDYATGQAKKLAKGAGSICVDDATVFGWIIHFFEEDSIKQGAKSRTVRTPGGVKTQAKKKPKPEKDPNILELFTFDEIGGEA